MSINVKQNGELTKIAGLYQTTAPIGMADCYSTEERQVGVFADGKPLYQKSFYNSGGNMSNYQYIVPTPSDLNGIVEHLVDWKCSIHDVTHDRDYCLDHNRIVISEDVRFSCYVDSDNTPYFVVLGATNSSFMTQVSNIYVTIQYTKTTDTPGSGQWTPSGAPAVHYSTEEQVIGTWIDGSTLYETTVSWPSVTAGGNTLITLAHGIPNIAKVINFDFTFGSDAYKFKTIPLTDPAWFAMVSAVTQASVQYRLGTSYSSYGLTMTIQYTKTTD